MHLPVTLRAHRAGARPRGSGPSHQGVPKCRALWGLGWVFSEEGRKLNTSRHLVSSVARPGQALAGGDS